MATQFESMGKTNAHWGVCGFTSSLYAIWQLNPGIRPRLANAPQPFTVIAEIKTYFMILLAKGETQKIKDIEDFSQSFGGDFSDWTVDAYCKRVNGAVSKTETDITKDLLFSVGMPPKLVQDYLERIWGRTSTLTEIPPGNDNGRDGIVGMIVPPGTKLNGAEIKTTYNGLVHYLYRHSNRYYSWGMPAFASIKAAQQGGAAALTKDWQIGWLIEM